MKTVAFFHTKHVRFDSIIKWGNCMQRKNNSLHYILVQLSFICNINTTHCSYIDNNTLSSTFTSQFVIYYTPFKVLNIDTYITVPSMRLCSLKNNEGMGKSEMYSVRGKRWEEERKRREEKRKDVWPRPLALSGIFFEMRFGESDPAESIQSTKNHSFSYIHTYTHRKTSGITCWPHNSCFPRSLWHLTSTAVEY